MTDTFRDKPSEIAEEIIKDDPRYSLKFIHLRNAKVFLPSQKPMPDGDGMFWRGKISSIDGYSIGNFDAHNDNI